MTVNERLVAAGLLQALDQAVLRGDRAEMLRILDSVDVPSPEANADTILADPGRYGYPSSRPSDSDASSN